MKPVVPKFQRCAIYTRKSTEHNLDLEFNSLDAQREACEAYIKSQEHEGWRLVPDRYNDGGLSGASLDRPALQQLLADVRAGKITIVVVYKVDRLTRSLADFAKLVELFDEFRVSFVSITQSFNTTSSMGRLTLNVLLSFAQFEREVIGERVRDIRCPRDLPTRRTDASVRRGAARDARAVRKPNPAIASPTQSGFLLEAEIRGQGSRRCQRALKGTSGCIGTRPARGSTTNPQCIHHLCPSRQPAREQARFRVTNILFERRNEPIVGRR